MRLYAVIGQEDVEDGVENAVAVEGVDPDRAAALSRAEQLAERFRRSRADQWQAVGDAYDGQVESEPPGAGDPIGYGVYRESGTFWECRFLVQETVEMGGLGDYIGALEQELLTAGALTHADLDRLRSRCGLPIIYSHVRR